MSSKSIILSFVLAAAVVTLPNTQAQAASSVKEFFKELSGKYRGRGSVVAPGDSKRQSVSCSITNSANGDNIKVSGNCATTRGKGRVSGKLQGAGTKVTGSFLSPFPGAKVLGSNGVFKNNRLAVITIFEAKNGGTTWVRQEVLKTSKGFNAKFFVRNSSTGKYEAAGALNFSKR